MRIVAVIAIVLSLTALNAAAQSLPSSQETGRVTFRGVVVGAGDGSALRGARVTLTSGRVTVGTVSTDVNGRFSASVPSSATLLLRIVKAGYASVLARVSPAQVVAADPLRLEVPRGAVITGRAVDASGQAAMLVVIRRVTTDGLSWSARGPDGLPFTDGFSTVNPDDRGEYRVTGLLTGRYTVEAYPPAASMAISAGRPGEGLSVKLDGASARAVSVTVDVPAGAEVTGVDLTVDRPPAEPATVDGTAEAAGGTIRGTVSTTDGSPLADATVTASRPGSLPAGSGGRTTRTDASGRFELRGVPAGSVNVNASKRGYVRSEAGQRGGGLPGLPVRVDAGKEVDNVSIVMPRSGAVSGLVLDEYGEPLEEARVQLLKVRRQPTGALTREQGSLAGQSDDRGLFRFSDVRPGDYVVMASVEDSSLFIVKPAEIADPPARASS
jgi:hypothetical protein